MNKIVDIQQHPDPRDVLHRSVEQLSRGGLIALPAETSYGACASVLQPDAVAKLVELDEREQSQHLTMLVKNKEEAYDYLPSLSPTARRLLKRCWPGPVTFAIPVDDGMMTGNNSLINSLAADVKSHILDADMLWLQAPNSDVLQQVLHLSNAPVVMLELVKPNDTGTNDTGTNDTGTNDTGEKALLFTAAAVSAAYQDKLSVIIDNGSTRYQQPPTVVKIDGDNWTIHSPGLVSEHIIKQMACEMYLFVCTGNTCRSPMAEGLFRKIMSDRLQCEPNAVVDRGMMAASAGLSAAIGAAASPETVHIMAERGIDLTDHTSQPLTNQLLDQADYIYTMTHQHRNSILTERPELKQRVEVLSRNGSDISDPIGGSMQDYVKCEHEIEKHLQSILNQHTTDKSAR